LKAEKGKGKKAKEDVVAKTKDFVVVNEAQSYCASKEVDKKQRSPLISFIQE
jgi:hypothetical protein